MKPPPPEMSGKGTDNKKARAAHRSTNTVRILAVCGPAISEAIEQSRVAEHAAEEHTTHHAVAEAGFGASPFLKGMRETLKECDKGVKDRGALFDAVLALTADFVGVPRSYVHKAGDGYGFFPKSTGANRWYDKIHGEYQRGVTDPERDKFDIKANNFFGVKVGLLLPRTPAWTSCLEYACAPCAR